VCSSDLLDVVAEPKTLYPFFLIQFTIMRRIKNGTHHFLSGESSSKYQKKMVNSKLHPFQNTEWQKTQQSKLVEKGTHHFLGEFSPTQVKWTCEKCGKSGKGKSNFSRWHSH
jgi:hypothetical protein